MNDSRYRLLYRALYDRSGALHIAIVCGCGSAWHTERADIH